MALETYRSKRNFAATSEPRGGKPLEDSEIFVVQKHDATRLHYDFRLALDGVLKSWAVTRGPSLVPGEKRLAVAVEDHPLEYADFEGTIAEGEYGGGAVILWDRGAWKPIGDPRKGLKKGHLDFELNGQKLKGRWHLIRMRAKPGEKRENWLLIKGDDEFARVPGGADILEERPELVKTGRSIDDVAGESPGSPSKTGKIERTGDTRSSAEPASGARKRPAADPATVEGAAEGPLPGFVEPMLATLAKSPPVGDRWLHEIKFDGYRLEARIEDGRVRLWTRSGLDWTEKFGDGIVKALRNLPLRTAMIDGELAVENESGASQFSLLQADLSEGRKDRFVYYAFDCLHLDGFDLREAPLIRRKALLDGLIQIGRGPLRYSSHFEEDGRLVLERACGLGLEGIVSKLGASAYRSGRGRSWVKCKCSARQEFVIAGYVPSSTGRKAIGALVLGVYDGPALRYVGRVGTGFSARVAEALFARLEPTGIASSPFEGRLSSTEAREVRFVRPELTAEVDFRAWTADGLLRQASFQGLREDKPAREIIRETTMTSDVAPERPQSSVKLTHPDRVYWPDVGVTKQGLADYYAEVWPYVAPFVVGRPLALVRCPDGIGGQTFFQKHAWQGLNPNIVLVNDPAEPVGRSADQHSRLRRPHRARAIGGARNPSLGVDRRRLGAAGQDRDGPRPGRRRRLAVGHRGGGGSPRPAEERGPRRLRQDLGRQGIARRRAGQATGRMAGRQGVREVDRRRNGGRQPRALCLDDPQGAAAWEDPHRLLAQPARHDCGRGLLDPRPAGRAGLHAARLE